MSESLITCVLLSHITIDWQICWRWAKGLTVQKEHHLMLHVKSCLSWETCRCHHHLCHSVSLPDNSVFEQRNKKMLVLDEIAYLAVVLMLCCISRCVAAHLRKCIASSLDVVHYVLSSWSQLSFSWTSRHLLLVLPFCCCLLFHCRVDVA